MKTRRSISWLAVLSTLTAIMIACSATNSWAGTVGQSDSQVKISVQYKLIKSGIMNGNNVDVAVANKKITLAGTVPTIYDIARAKKIAENVEKNFEVINNLTVLAPAVPDSVVSKEVMHQIETHTFYTAFDWVTTNVHHGVVTLNGWVDAPWYIKQYQDQANRVVGVKRVVNNLKTAIGSVGLKYRAYRLIYSDPFYQPYALEINPPIHIIVNGPDLILEGNVQTSGERGYLSDLMLFHTNAPNVVDNIQVASD
ncbi:MAG: BON domain-containing protein [Bacteroidetes bacterium]|nr:BON domain-containing protein [Bacteroidota bacterium]